MKLRSLFFHAYPAEGSNQRLIRASRRFPGALHQLAEHFLKLRQRGGPGIAGGAGIRRGGLAEEGQILFLQLFQLRGDAHIDGQLTHRVHRTPRASAMALNFSPVYSALNSMTMGSIIAQATPCGVS